jgi:hypothetical protein
MKAFCQCKTLTICLQQTAAKIERAWSVNNSIMLHEPQSTLDATNRVVGILDAKYEKADLRSHNMASLRATSKECEIICL